MRIFLTALAILALSVVLALSPHLAVEIITPIGQWLLFFVTVAAFVWWRNRIDERCQYIATCLNEAEYNFNNLINAGMDASGRLVKMEERMRWAALIPKHPVHLVGPEDNTPIHALFSKYEADIQSVKGDKKVINHTANLLRDLLNGSVRGAQIWIEGQYRINKALPYVAPGIAELVGLEHFCEESGKFLPGAGIDWRLLKRVVRRGRYPKQIILVKGTTAIHGMDALNKLTAHHL